MDDVLAPDFEEVEVPEQDQFGDMRGDEEELEEVVEFELPVLDELRVEVFE